MTVGVAVACSNAYAHLLPAWAASVAGLRRRPDFVAMAVESLTGDGVHEAMQRLATVTQLTLVRVDPPFDFARWWNAALGACEADWIAWAGADDRYLPHALDGLEDYAHANTGAIAWGLRYDTGQEWRPGPATAGQLRYSPRNLVPCGSPVRRAAWEASPLRSEFGPLADWGLWAGLGRDGWSVSATGDIRVDYAYAGHHAPDDEPWMTRILTWAKEAA